MSEKKCRSKAFPCKAGVKCPDHKYVLSTHSTKERVTSLLKDGVPSKVTLVPVIARTGFRDKDLIVSLEKAYPDKIGVYIQQEKIAFTVKKFRIKNRESFSEEDEVSVLCSLVAYTDSSQYSYASVAPFSDRSYFIAGFEPNPFFGGNSMVTEEELERINKGWAFHAGAHPNNPGNPVNHLRKLRKYPYVKIRGGFRLTDYVNVDYKDYGKIFKAEKQRMKLYLANSQGTKVSVSSLV